MTSKLRELLLTLFVVALIFSAARAYEAYVSRPLIYLEGTFPTFIESEGWNYVVRYTVDGVPCQMFAPNEARAKRFIVYLKRVGTVINASEKVKSAHKALDSNP